MRAVGKAKKQQQRITPHTSGDYSLQRIQRLVWFPIAVLITVLISTLFIQEILESINHEERFAESWNSVWTRHEPLFANEVFLGQTEALKKRSGEIAAELAASFPGYGYCIKATPKIQRAEPIDLCQNHESTLVTSFELRMGPELLADVKVAQTASPTLVDQVPARVLWSVLLSILVSILVVYMIGRSVVKSVVTPLLAVIEGRSRDAAIGRTSQMLAHDVRRPFSLLEIAMQAVENAQTPAAALDALKRHLPALRSAQKRTTRMLHDVMLVGKSDKVALSPKPVSLRKLVQDAVTELESLCRSKDITVKTTFAHKYKALIERSKIERVVSNLLVNAVEAANPSSVVDVRTRALENGEIEIKVHNTGSYISEKQRTKIFEAFHTEGKREGTGLGLTIAKIFVELHGGEIWCESTKAEGTTFAFTVPADTVAIDRIEGASASHGVAPNTFSENPERMQIALNVQGQKNTIFIVEDDPFVREAWGNSIKGFQVRLYESPNALLMDLKSNGRLLDSAVCIVTDFHFDNDTRNGVDLIEELRKLGVDLPFYISSDIIFAERLPEGVQLIPKGEMPFNATAATCDLPSGND